MPVTHDKVLSEDIIDVMLSNLRGEFGGSTHCYYGTSFEKKANKSIRFSVVNQSNSETNYGKFLNNYNLELKYYIILGRETNLAYKTFFYDMHRLEQSLLALQPTADFLNFKIDSIAINDYLDNEESVAGLYTATFLISFSLLKG